MTRELDARVAEAMGLNLVQGQAPRYSENIAAAWQVVKWMTSRGWLAELECLPLVPSPMWFVHFNYYRDGESSRYRGYAEGGVCAQAVCHAFLEAMRDKRIRSKRSKVPELPPAPPPQVIRRG